MTRRWLVLRLEAPLLAFGAVAIDQVRPTSDFPGLSMLTGLLANALGWRRTDAAAHQRLQDRIVFAARLDRLWSTGVLLDVQNAQLSKNDRGWTTRGAPEGRGGGADTYSAPHRRFRDYLADAAFVVALRLEPEDEAPSLDDVAGALDRPARPLFIGRKPCLPSLPLRWRSDEGRSFVEADSAYAALLRIPALGEQDGSLAALWPEGEGPSTAPAATLGRRVADLRDWTSGLAVGDRLVFEGVVEIGGREEL